MSGAMVIAVWVQILGGSAGGWRTLGRPSRGDSEAWRSGQISLGRAPATAATHGYIVAFAVSAGIFGLGVILAIVLLPSRQRLAELRAPAAAAEAEAASPAAVPASAAARAAASAPAAAPHTAAPVAHLAPELEADVMHAIPAALCGCSPVINRALLPAGRPGG
jgi:hypothetical protein